MLVIVIGHWSILVLFTSFPCGFSLSRKKAKMMTKQSTTTKEFHILNKCLKQSNSYHWLKEEGLMSVGQGLLVLL